MIGKTISHYRISEQLGEGGMGIVYKAYDTKLEREVALKFLSSEQVSGNEEKARFINEARSAASLDHPNICTIYEIGETDKSQPYISMALVDGRELSSVLADGRMPIERALDIAVQVAAGLEAAHDKGVVHRDIKASNIMVTEKGRALVMDFGLARQRGATQLTQAGMSMGTIDYMSPEQASGDPIDHHTDIWSFGVMLYEMLAGKRPFHAEFDQAVVYSILNTDPKPIREVRADVPDGLATIIDRCLAKKPVERYQTMQEVLDDLHTLQVEQGFVARHSSGVRTASVATGGGSFVNKLIARRIPQVVLGYAIVTILVWQGLKLLVNKFPVSPHLPDFGLIALVSLLPAVLLIAYFHRNLAYRNWPAVESVGVPINLALSAALLFFIFGNKDLGAATTTVEVTDEQGNVVERVIPKPEFRKRLAIFYHDNESGDPELDWLQYGSMYALNLDLAQDEYVSLSMGFTRFHEREGFPKAVGSPLTLKRQFASENSDPYFLAGTVSRDGTAYVVKNTLYDTKKGSPIAQYEFRDENVFAIVDSMSRVLRQAIGIPEYHIEEMTDLPVSEILTKSTDAYRLYVMSERTWLEQNDYEAAIRMCEEAVAIDPAFAQAHWDLRNMYFGVNRGEDAIRAIETAMRHRYKLPERVQFDLRDDYYETKQDMDAALDNAKHWVKLYPADAKGRNALANYYTARSEYDLAIAQRETILNDVDPNDFDQLRWIARLHETKGEPQTALEYYERYADEFPDKWESFSEIGRVYGMVGQLEAAKDSYKQALVIAPDRIEPRLALANTERRMGNFEVSLKEIDRAFGDSQTLRDSTAVREVLMYYYAFRGECEDAVREFELFVDGQYRTQSPVQALVNQIFGVSMYVEAGRPQQAFEVLDGIEIEKSMPWLAPLVDAGYLIAHAVNDDPAAADVTEQHLEAFEEWVDNTNNESLRWVVMYLRAVVKRWRGDVQGALTDTQAAIEVAPQGEVERIVNMYNFAGMCAREAGAYELGIGLLEQATTLEPVHPWAHLELAMIYNDMNDPARAAQHLDVSLRTYENACEPQREARRARELHAQLTEAAKAP